MSSSNLKTSASGLPARFQIRRLEDKHIPFATALGTHCGIFHSPVWPILYPEGKTARAMADFQASDYPIRHSIQSGMSFGVFDTEYKYKNQGSVPTEGRCYWDVQNKDASAEDLLEQIDFPLVSIALAYDGINELDIEKLGPVMAVLPLYCQVPSILDSLDKRSHSEWEPTGPKQVLMRSGTATRHGYEGYGLMKALAHFVMHEAKMEGFRGISIESLHDSVRHVWSNPPSPFTADVVAEFDMTDWEDTDKETGEKVKIFAPVKQRAAKIYVHL